MVRSLLALSALCAVSLAALTFQIEPRSEECFHFDVPGAVPVGESAQVRWQVTRGGLLDVGVRLAAPDNSELLNKMHFEANGDSKGYFDFVPNLQGTYSLCFDNKMSRFTAKVIQFSVVAGVDPSLKPLTPGDLDPIQRTVMRIDTLLNDVASMQKYYRRREAMNRNTAESTNGRVQNFSLIACVVIAAMSIGHTMILKHWFNK
eukprot:m51a1_g2771 putative C-tail anchored protein, emp24/gp25L/p24 family/GOLD (204) ;mRNA; r:1020916-1021880